MNPDWIMAIIALSAILSPTIVAIIDNVAKFKTKKFELKMPKKQQVLCDFISNAMENYASHSYPYTVKYVASKNNLYVYFSNVPDDELNKLDNFKELRQLDKYKNCISSITKKLSQQIDK